MPHSALGVECRVSGFGSHLPHISGCGLYAVQCLWYSGFVVRGSGFVVRGSGFGVSGSVFGDGSLNLRLALLIDLTASELSTLIRAEVLRVACRLVLVDTGHHQVPVHQLHFRGSRFEVRVSAVRVAGVGCPVKGAGWV